MNDPDNFALVVKPPGALGKAEPGAKHVLYGMVADTLALAQNHNTRPVRIVVLDDQEEVRNRYRALLRIFFNEPTIIEFKNGPAAWRELSRTTPDLFITDLTHGDLDGVEMLRLLAEKGAKYPILVISGTLPYRAAEARFAGQDLNVSFWEKPFDDDLLGQFLREQVDAELSDE